MTIDPNQLDTLADAIRFYETATTAWQRRVALDIYRATASPGIVGALINEFIANAPTNAELDHVAHDLRVLANRIDAYGTHQPAAAGYVAVISITGDITRKESSMAFVLQIGQGSDLSVTYQDAHGNTAEVESQTWTSSDDTILTVTGDGTNATMTAEEVGTAQVQLVADARFGDDVAEIRAVLDVEVVAAEAVSAVITPGEPHDAGTTGGGGGEPPVDPGTGDTTPQG